MSSSNHSVLAPETLHRVCPLCGRDNRRLPPSRYSRATWRLKHCADCELLFLENALPCESLIQVHNWQKSFADERRRRNEQLAWARVRTTWKRLRVRWLPHQKAEALVRRYVVAGNLLDVGCGSGYLLSRLPASIVPHGIEIDSEAIHTAQSRVAHRGGRILHMDALQGLCALESETMKGILMVSFLEHDIRPLEVLREAHRVLKPEGVIILKVPNFDCWNRCWRGSEWPGFRFPDHVNYFTPRTLPPLVRKSGLSILRFSCFDRLPTSDNMWLVACKTSPTQRRMPARSAA